MSFVYLLHVVINGVQLPVTVSLGASLNN